MQYRVSAIETMLRVSPDGEVKRSLPQDTDVGEGVETEDHKWLQIGFGKEEDQKGFVLASDCKDKAGEPRREVPRDALVQMCVVTEMRFNATDSIKPWYVLADFLIARSIVETGITNVGSMIPDSDGIGPMQISTKEWNDFVQNGGVLVRHRAEIDRQDPIRQIDAAAFRMHSDMRALSALRTSADATDLFVPQFLDVFFAYLTDSPGAALALRDAIASSENRNEPVTKFLHGPLTDAQVTALHKARSRFFGTEASAKSLNDVINGVKTALDTALDRAFQDIKLFIREAVPVVSVPEPGGAGTTFMEKAPVIMRALIADFGFTDFQAAGILGNFGRETGGFTLFQERHPKSGRGGIGWAQWTDVRRVNFEKFCSDNNLDQNSDKANYGFLKHEMTSTPEKKVVAPLKQTQTLDEATELFMKEYERPGVKALGERKIWARRALDAFNGVGTLGTDAQTLQQQINAGKIIFDSSRLRSELLGLNTGTKVTAKLQALVLNLSKLTPVIRISSLVRSGTGSHHTEGRAVDIGNEEIAAALLPQIATPAQIAALGIDELIFDAAIIHEPDRNKFNFDQGAKHNFNEATLNAHGNHIHVAVKA